VSRGGGVKRVVLLCWWPKKRLRLAFERGRGGGEQNIPTVLRTLAVVWVEGDSHCHDGKGDPPQSHWYLCNWF